MKAKINSYVSGDPMWTVEAEPGDYVSGMYQVFRGHYSLRRYTNGVGRQISIMHKRYTALRTKIDAAIAAAK